MLSGRCHLIRRENHVAQYVRPQGPLEALSQAAWPFIRATVKTRLRRHCRIVEAG